MRLGLAGVVMACAVVTGCGAAVATSGGARIADAERMRASLASREDVARRAPQPYAVAEGELRLAKEADALGDALGAELHGERALAAYAHAVALTRVARATDAEAEARRALADAEAQATRTSTQRRAMDREVDELDKELKIARDLQLPAPSGPADPDRERARTVAARSLVTQARLLCSAARLVSESAPGLAEAEATVKDLEGRDRASAPKRAADLVDAAARVRAACLGTLTKARRAKASADAPDTLLAELSQSLAAPSGQGTKAEPASPARDERGVVVTLARPWKGNGDELAPEAAATLKDLGRVAAAHPGVGVQVVLHDDAPKADTGAARRRLAAAARALEAGGATKTVQEHAGANAPLVDPTDAKRRDVNARLEIVFVL